MLETTHTRRNALAWLAAGIAVPALAACGSAAQARTFRVTMTEAQWRSKLTPAQFKILRQADTERPYSSPLNNEHRTGTFQCVGCDNDLYASNTKFDSGTGWPSFYQPLTGAIYTSTDLALGYPRKEVHCADCGGHLGHVFDDGPQPTGLRYCMNGAVMKFRTA